MKSVQDQLPSFPNTVCCPPQRERSPKGFLCSSCTAWSALLFRVPARLVAFCRVSMLRLKRLCESGQRWAVSVSTTLTCLKKRSLRRTSSNRCLRGRTTSLVVACRPWHRTSRTAAVHVRSSCVGIVVLARNARKQCSQSGSWLRDA